MPSTPPVTSPTQEEETPLPLQPQRKKKPHQIFRQAPTSLVNNQISTLHPLTLKTFHQQIAPYYLFSITLINRVHPPSSLMSHRRRGRGRAPANPFPPP